MTPRKLAVRVVSALAVVSGLTHRRRLRRHRRGDFRLYALEYHDVTTGGVEPEGTVSAQRFGEHLEYFGRHFRLETLAAAARQLEAPGGLERDLAVITFDDGYAGNYEAAWPVLHAAGAPATFFLTTGFLDGAELWVDFARRAIDACRSALGAGSAAAEVLRGALGSWPTAESTDGLMRRLKYLPPDRRDLVLKALRDAGLALASPARPLSWDQAAEMAAAGAELGAHTVTHPILSTLEPSAQEEEILDSRQRIADVTGIEPSTFAYPNGSARDYDRHTVEILRRAGFRAACTTRRGSNRPGDDRLTLKRIGIGSDPLFVVEARLAGLFDEEVRSRLRR